MYKTNLKALKDERTLRQEDIAKILNITRGSYSHYESEDDIMPIKHLNTLCNYFNVSLDYIFSFTPTRLYQNSKKEINVLLSKQRLKEFRKEENLTLKNLGKSLNYSYGTIAGYESGRYIIATPFLYAICKKYNLSADYLLGKIDSPKYFK